MPASPLGRPSRSHLRCVTGPRNSACAGSVLGAVRRPRAPGGLPVRDRPHRVAVSSRPHGRIAGRPASIVSYETRRARRDPVPGAAGRHRGRRRSSTASGCCRSGAAALLDRCPAAGSGSRSDEPARRTPLARPTTGVHRSSGRCSIGVVAAGERSAAERRADRACCGSAGITGWTANVRDPRRDRVSIGVADVVFAEARLVVEVDGLAYHVTPDRFQRDRHRQNRLIAAGWTVLRFTWRDLTSGPGMWSRRSGECWRTIGLTHARASSLSDLATSGKGHLVTGGPRIGSRLWPMSL